MNITLCSQASKGHPMLATLDEEEQRQMRSMISRAETLAEVGVASKKWGGRGVNG